MLNFLRSLIGWAMLLSTACLAIAADNPPSGITLHSMRIIYPESAKKGVTFSLTNNTEQTYLMQSWIQHLDMNTGQVADEVESTDNTANAIPFIITPPLKRIEAGEKLTLLIRQTSRDLPTDLESVFFVSVKAIPSTQEKNTQANSQLIVAIVNNIKLFYRPDGLPKGGVKQAATSLRFSQQGDRLIVDNPTPFYFTFAYLAIGGETVDSSELRILVPPKGQAKYPLPKEAKGDVQWQLLDENMEVTPIKRQSL